MSAETMEEMKRARKAKGGVRPQLRDLDKRTRHLEKTIREALGEEALSPPALAEKTGLDLREVFWQLNAMRKYGQLTIEGQDGSYLSYRLINKDA